MQTSYTLKFYGLSQHSGLQIWVRPAMPTFSLSMVLFMLVSFGFLIGTTSVLAQTPRYVSVLSKTADTLRDRPETELSRPYANNQNNFWLIKPASPLGTAGIVLRFDSLNTQRGRDVIRIFAGGTEQRLDTSKLIATVSGVNAPVAILITNSSVTVQFITDGSVAGEARAAFTGWKMNYISFTKILTASEGVFRDREGEALMRDYEPNLDVFWLIRPPEARQILVQFDSLNLEDEFDYVSVIAGVEEQRTMVDLTGSVLPRPIAVNDSLVVIRFTTDESFSGDDSRFTSGWTLRYTSSTRATVLRPDNNYIEFSAVDIGAESDVKSFRLSGTAFLDDITIIAPEGFKIATVATLAFTDTLRIITPKNSTNVLRGQILVRFVPKRAGEYYDFLTIRSGTIEESIELYGLGKPVIFWESTNGPNSGQITALASTAGNVMLAGTRHGVFRSNSNGAVWAASNTGLTTANARRIRFITPVSEQIGLVYLGTNTGLFVSSDTGKTWRSAGMTGIPRNADVNCILQTNGRLLMGTTQGLYRFEQNRWLDAMQGFAAKNVSVLTIASHGGNLYAGTLSNGAYVSTNGGDRWSPANGESSSSTDALPTDGQYAVSRFLSVPRSDGGQELWAFVDSVDADYEGYIDYSEIYRSRDNGATWVYEDLDSLYNNNLWAVYSALVHSGTLYLGTDGGVVRRRLGNAETAGVWNIPKDPTAIGFVEPTALKLILNGSSLFAGTNGGIVRSRNQGLTWQTANTGLTAAQVFAMANVKGAVLAGTGGSGVFRSADNGATWQTANNGLRGVYIGGFVVQNDAVFTATYNDRAGNWDRNGVSRSLDNGLTWVQMSKFPESNNRNAPPLSPQPDVYAIGQSGSLQSGVNILFAGTSYFAEDTYLFASTTGGVSWRNIDLPSVALSSPIYAIEGTPTGGVYVGLYGEGVLWSPNPLASKPEWSRIDYDFDTPDFIEYNIRALATFNGDLYAATDSGLYRTNGARTRFLSLEDVGIPKAITSATILSLFVQGGMLYVGSSETGVWRSEDGKKWEHLNDDFLTSSVDVYAMTSDGSSMYAGLDGNSIFRTSLTQGATTSRTFLEIPDFYRASPGDTLEIAIRMGARRNIPALLPAAMPQVSGILRFNASLLEPLDEAVRFQSVVSNGERLINFRAPLRSDPQIRLTRDSTIAKFRFRALLGNSVATPLTLTNLSAQNITLLANRPGLFTLTGLSDAGGTRLFVAESKPIVAVAPNPTSGALTISLKTFESGATSVSVSNIFGNIVKTIANADFVEGDYDFSAALSDLPQGVYFVVVQTPSQRLSRQIHLLK